VQNSVNLQELCTGLEQFGLPSAIANLNEQRFVAWNAILLEQTRFSGTEISMLAVGSTIVLTDSTILEAGRTEKYSPGLIPCVGSAWTQHSAWVLSHGQLSSGSAVEISE
jgi:hypothetical protein